MTVRRMRALHAGYLRLQTHTLRLCNTHCFSTTTVLARTHLNDTLYVHCLSCFIFPCLFVCLNFSLFSFSCFFLTLLPLFSLCFFFSFIICLFLFPLCSILFFVLFLSFLLLLFHFLPCWCFLYFFILLLILYICPRNCVAAVGGACITYGDRSSALRFW